VLRTLDGGAHWSALDARVTSHLRAVRFASTTIGWAAGDGGAIIKTTDGGANWTPQSSGVQLALLGLAVSGTTQAWAVGEGGTLVRTTDGGTTWTPNTVGTGRLYAVHFGSATAGWIVGQDGGIWTTIDGGATWVSRATSAVRAHLRAVAFLDAVTGWAVGDRGTLLKTVDGGVTWTSQNAGVTATLRAVAVRDATQVIVAGDEGTLLITNDGGATWQSIDAGQSDTALRAIALGAAPDGWVVGDASALVRLGSSPGPVLEPLIGVSFSIEPGRLYVKGVLCEADERASFYNQPDRRVATRLEPGTYLAYLDVWQRYISSLEDPRIREVALGGPDTAGRSKTVWQVRALPLEDVSPPAWTCVSEIPGWAELTATPKARLRSRSEQEQLPATLCEIGAAGGFRRVENQLYRVEVQDGGSSPTFKWSRENGSVAFAITGAVESGGRTTVTLATRGLDDNLELVEDGWVEVVDDDALGEQGVGVLRRFIGRGNDPLEVVLDGVLGSIGTTPDKHPLLRRWDHKPTGTASALPIQEATWIPLEDGVEVFFDLGGTYRPGDFWQIPARTITADVEWPRDEHGKPIARPPAGVEHRYCRLAIFDVGVDGAIHIASDCRELFPPITELTLLLYTSGDGQDGIPGQPLPQPLQVRVARGEHPIANAIVRFEVTSGQGQLVGAGPGTPLDVITDAEGIAECRWSLDADLGPAKRFQTVDARLLDAADVPVDGQRVVFCATGTLALEYVSGDGQQALAGQALAHALEVRVANGQQPVPGIPVQFAVMQGGGALVGPNPALSGADGVASIAWQLGAAGAQRVEAEIRAADAARVQHLGFNADIVSVPAAQGGCATTIGPNGGEFKQLTDEVLRLLLDKFRGNVCICFLPGAHEIEGIQIDAPGTARLSIHGCGHASLLHLVRPIRMSGFGSVEISHLSLQMDEGVGLLFENCSEVALQSLSITANPSDTPAVRVIAASTAAVTGCTITTKLPGLAVVFDDAQAAVRFTDNDVRGVVSFYGQPVTRPGPDVRKLLASFQRPTVRINAARGSLFMSRNTLETLTVGRSKFAELDDFADQTRETLDDLFRAAAVTDNIVTSREAPLLLARTVSLAGLSFPLEFRADPLGIFVAEAATATGTVGLRDPGSPLAVVTRVGGCVEAANLPIILKNP
jgi:photosystem II stability/assembly factor-like uncharacterized protein